MNKFRLVKRARGWVVQQQNHPLPANHEQFTRPINKEKWFDRGCWKFRWCGLLHLLWLRERARK